jgi:hypothetical protein
LGIRMGAKLGRKLKARVVDNIDDPRDYTIEFVPDSIRIRYGNNVIWQKSVAGLASAGDGKRLLEQLDRELKAQGLAEDSLSGSPKVGEPAPSHCTNTASFSRPATTTTRSNTRSAY